MPASFSTAAGAGGPKMLAAFGTVPIQMPIPQVPESLAHQERFRWAVIAVGDHAVAQAGRDMQDTHGGVEQAGEVEQFHFLSRDERCEYESLPTALREVIDRNSGRDLSRRAGEIWDSTAWAGLQPAKARGSNTFHPARR
jgi:TRAP-type transport system periplasmic protein